MHENAEIKLPLLILISFFIHLIFITGAMLPSFKNLYNLSTVKKIYNYGRSGSDEGIYGRDIIVNINPDDKRVISKNTLLSDRDSSAKGHITKEKGDQWLNNSRDFLSQKGSPINGVSQSGAKAGHGREKISTGIQVTDNTEAIISVCQGDIAGSYGFGGDSNFTKIPDRFSFSNKNAIYYSNTGLFSFNTAKFKDFQYFKQMKDRIAANWFPPLLANSVIGGYDPMTGGYTPGRLRIMAIPNQIVKLYFTMNRNGDVMDVVIVDSMGNTSLNSSCIEAIRNSKTFGKVPDDIKGERVIIPFMFGYIVY